MREQLGGTGSPNTIHKHLSVWRQSRPAAEVSLSVEFKAAIIAEIGRAVAKAQQQSDEALNDARREAADLAACASHLEAQLDQARQQILQTTSERDELIGKARQQNIDIVRQRRDLEEKQEQIGALRANLQAATQRVEQLEQRVIAQDARIGCLSDEISVGRQCHAAELKRAQGRLQTLEDSIVGALLLLPQDNDGKRLLEVALRDLSAEP